MKRAQIQNNDVGPVVVAAAPSTSSQGQLSGVGTRTRRSGRFGMGGSATEPLTINVKTNSSSSPDNETNEQRMTRKLTRSQCPSGPPSETPSVTDDTTSCTPSSTSKRASKISKTSRKSGAGVSGQTVELFRTDYITAMKMSDNDAAATADNLLVIDDSWRQDWNRGVQVPVNNVVKVKPEWRPLGTTEAVDIPSVQTDDKNAKDTKGFKLPAQKYVCLSKTGNQSSNKYYRGDWHKVVHTAKQADQVCPYDMDDMDAQWLAAFNKHRRGKGVPDISASDFERVIECVENQCAENIDQAIVAPGNTSAGREFDDDSVCDVCMSPNQEEEDAIVFCDGCDLCVHQSCYGVPELPSGPWLCRVCALVGGRLPPCELCPNRGGAMKCTQSGERWAHISCVLWIPEVRFGDPELLEPVMHLRSVPEDRWLLRCSLCDKREGACIQCDVKACRMSYHVTCAQRKSLEMRSETKANGELQLLSYCSRHSRHGASSGGLFDHPSDSTPTKAGASKRSSGRTAASRNSNATETPSQQQQHQQTLLDSPRKRKARRVQTMYCRFYQFASVDGCAAKLGLDPAAIVAPVFEYWKLKRRRNNNNPLLTSREDEAEMLERQEEEALIRRVRTLIALRQNLEKARNLCYMIGRREKEKKKYVDVIGDTCALMAPIVDDDKCLLSRRESAALSSNYLRPLAGFDECIFPRVTDEHVEEAVEKWISDTGGVKRSPVEQPVASCSGTQPQQQASGSRQRRSSSRQAGSISALDLMTTPEKNSLTPDKADAYRQADAYWLKQAEVARDNNHNRIGMLSMNGPLQYTAEDEDVNVVDGDSSSVASDDSGIQTSVPSSQRVYRPPEALSSWYKQQPAPAHVTAAHRLITAQQQRRRQLAMAAASDRLRSPNAQRTTIVRAVGQPYRLERSPGSAVPVNVQQTPPSGDRVRRRYPVVTTRRGYYTGASAVQPLYAARSSATPRLLSSPTSNNNNTAVGSTRFTISVPHHHSSSALKRVAAPHQWATDPKRSRLSPSGLQQQIASRRSIGSSPVSSRSPIVILNSHAATTAQQQQQQLDKRATRSALGSDPFEFGT